MFAALQYVGKFVYEHICLIYSNSSFACIFKDMMVNNNILQLHQDDKQNDINASFPAQFLDFRFFKAAV